MGVDVVCLPSMGVDVIRPMPVGGMHLLACTHRLWVPHSPMPAHVAYPPSSQLGIGVDVASGTSRPTLSDARLGLHKTRPAHASQYAAVCTGVQVHRLRL